MAFLGQKLLKRTAEAFNGLGGFDKFQGLVRDFHHELVDVEGVGPGVLGLSDCRADAAACWSGRPDCPRVC